MNRRVVLQAGALLWAMIGAAIAIPTWLTMGEGAVLLVGVASILGPSAAVAASWLLAGREARWAGALLLASVFTPTYFFAVLNLPALLVGIALLVAPDKALPIGAESGMAPKVS